ncbi:protein white-like [Aricia agestis]|uniref:protein white-like n=1 Tax=Aricia agestis TaxID=91739 RepID=UPI001C20A086|nr:protein white-like [Aricia agestis]
MLFDEKNYGVQLRADNLNVWTPGVKSWRRKIVKPATNILCDVSVSIKSGEFVAILGPSGAGKTTLLASLAGKCNLPSSGSVTINGEDVRELQRAVDIVPQRDVFMDDLYVREHLVFMTEMKLGSTKNIENLNVLNALVRELNLKHLEDSPVSALSGGERRLLSLATSLLSNPQIVVCDEPTTGLDSSNANLVVDVLKKLSLSGKVVICTLHQPSSDLFAKFDSLCLMSEGKLIYHGSHEDCRRVFESAKLKCPTNYNPAEFYIKAVSDGSIVERIHRPDCQTASQTPIPRQLFQRFRRNWFKQVSLLLWRSLLTFKRTLSGFFIRIFISTLFSSLIIGTCFVGISGTTQRGIQDFRGFLWLMCSEVSFILSYNALYAFEADLTLFKREVGIYNASAFYVSRFLTMVPRCVLWPIAYVMTATSAVDLPNRLLTTAEFVAALVVTAFGSTAYGLGMGALFLTTGVMGDVMPCVDLPLFLMSGAFIRISSLPLWLYPIKYASHFYYGMDALSNIYWRQIQKIDCPLNSTLCLPNGEAVLMESGYSSDFVYQDSLGLATVTAVWSIVGYCGLRREESKGYAY